MTPEYELNSEIGELYPILLDSKGNLIDGFHRRSHKKSWHTIKLAQIRTKADLLTARIIANCQRLDHSEESGKWVNELANELSKEHSDLAMSTRIVKLTGMSKDWVLNRLDDKFKDLKKATKKPVPKVESTLSTDDIEESNAFGMPLEPPRVQDDTKSWVLKRWNDIFGKLQNQIPETNAVNDLLPLERKQILRQLKDLQVKITAWIEAVEEV